MSRALLVGHIMLQTAVFFVRKQQERAAPGVGTRRGRWLPRAGHRSQARPGWWKPTTCPGRSLKGALEQWADGAWVGVWVRLIRLVCLPQSTIFMCAGEISLAVTVRLVTWEYAGWIGKLTGCHSSEHTAKSRLASPGTSPLVSAH